MNYPKEVQERIDVLSIYKDTETLSTFDIFHLYPEELCYPDGYYDSRWFKLIGFNTTLMQKQDLGRHDGIDIDEGIEVQRCRIYADGSTFIKFREPVKVMQWQSIRVMPAFLAD